MSKLYVLLKYDNTGFAEVIRILSDMEVAKEITKTLRSMEDGNLYDWEEVDYDPNSDKQWFVGYLLKNREYFLGKESKENIQ